MIDEKEKTVLNSSVGADEGQSVSKSNFSIAENNVECNTQKKTLEELTRELKRINNPNFLPTIAMTELESEIKSKKIKSELLSKKIEHLTETEEQITQISKKFDEEEEYQLPEPPPIMSAKTYKTKYAEPLIAKLKSLVKEVIVRYMNAKKDFDRWRIANIKLADENDRLYKEIDRLKEDIGFYKKQFSDYKFLRKIIGSRKVDEILTQAKAAKDHSKTHIR